MDTDKIRYWLFADRIPLTKLLIVSNVVTFVGLALFRAGGLLSYAVFLSSTAGARPWTALTYPLIGAYGGGLNGFISLLFGGYWLWVAGGTLERSWGSGRFAAYFFQVTAISAAAMYVGTLATGIPVGLAGLWLVLAGVTVAFGMLNPETIVLFMLIIPLKLKYLALISAAMVLISYAGQSPLLGVFALAGCAFSYWYVRTARYSGAESWPQSRTEVIRVHERESLLSKLNPLKWLRHHRSQKRLRKLFEDSGLDEDNRR